jgi:hypothetical protein
VPLWAPSTLNYFLAGGQSADDARYEALSDTLP